MTRPAPTSPSLHMRLTALTVVAVVLAFSVLALAPVKPPVTSDELSGAIDHLSSVANASEGAASPPAAHHSDGR